MHPEPEFDEARTFRPRQGGLSMMLISNAILAVALLGVPYVRGQFRAREALTGFSKFAACLFGGSVQASPGLAMPPEDRERFAEQVRSAGVGWPSQCTIELMAMRPDPAIFLFPSTKEAEEQLRRAIELLQAELDGLGRNRNDRQVGSVPERVMRGVAQVRASLRNVVDASGVMVDVDRQAIEFDGPLETLVPSKIPLRIAASGTTLVRPESGAVRALATDGRGVTEVVVSEGSLQVVDARRPASVHGIVFGSEASFLVWLTSESRCRADPHHCSTRTTGLGRMVRGNPEAEWWLGGHPAGRVDRSLEIHGSFATLLAKAGENGVEIRTFEMAERGTAAADSAEREPRGSPSEAELQRPLAPLDRHTMDRPLDFALSEGIVTWAEQDDSVTLHSMTIRSGQLGEDRAVLTRLERARPGRTWVSHCEGWRAVATPDAIALVTPDDIALDPLSTELREPMLGTDHADDPISLACRGASLSVFAITQHRELRAWNCTAAGCDGGRTLDTNATQIDSARIGDTAVVAWRGDESQPQIRVVRLAADRTAAATPARPEATPARPEATPARPEATPARPEGMSIVRPEIPAPCWDSGEGFCGTPRFATDGSRVLLTTRERGDLLVLELTPDGYHRLPRL